MPLSSSLGAILCYDDLDVTETHPTLQVKHPAARLLQHDKWFAAAKIEEPSPPELPAAEAAEEAGAGPPGEPSLYLPSASDARSAR